MALRRRQSQTDKIGASSHTIDYVLLIQNIQNVKGKSNKLQQSLRMMLHTNVEGFPVKFVNPVSMKQNSLSLILYTLFPMLYALSLLL